MLDFPTVFQGISFALEKIIAPLAILWFTYHWSHLPVGEIEPQKEPRITSAGVSIGLFAAVLALWLFFYLYVPSSGCSQAAFQSLVSGPQLSIAYFKDLSTSFKVDCLFGLSGLTIGVLTGFAGLIKKASLGSKYPPGVAPPVPAGAKQIKQKWIWILIVIFITGMGAFSLVLYYLGVPYCRPHLWFMWAYLFMIVGYRIALAINATK